MTLKMIFSKQAKRLCCCLLFVTALFFLPLGPAWAQCPDESPLQLFSGGGEVHPEISGDWVVWGQENADFSTSSIIAKNVVTCEEVVISSALPHYVKLNPRIDYPLVSYEGEEGILHIYDLETRVDTPIPGAKGRYPVVKNNKVVWVHYIEGVQSVAEILVHDLTTGITRSVNTPDTMTTNIIEALDFDGRFAVWKRRVPPEPGEDLVRMDKLGLAIYDLEGEYPPQEFFLLDAYDIQSPRVDGGRVVWTKVIDTGTRHPEGDIVVSLIDKNVSDDIQEIFVADGAGWSREPSTPDIDGDMVVFSALVEAPADSPNGDFDSRYHLYAYDINTKQRRLLIDNEFHQYYPAISGNKIVALRGEGQTVRRIIAKENVYLFDLEELNAPVMNSFMRGDTNSDGKLDISDGINFLNILFGDMNFDCEDAADANDDGVLDIRDGIGILNHLFQEEVETLASFGQCAVDLTPDELSCESYSPCQ